MEVYKISTDHLDAFGFGKRTYSETINQKQIFNGISPTNFDLKTQCVSILEDNHNVVNKILIERLLLEQMIKPNGVADVTNILLDAFNQVTNTYATVHIQKALDNGTFTVSDFLTRYQKLFNNSNILRKNLAHYDNNMKYDNGKFSLISLMKNMSLYNNVINRTYRYADKNMYLYEILCSESVKFIEGSESVAESNLQAIISIFKIYQFYNRFSSISTITVEAKDKYFNKELINKFTIGNSQNGLFLIGKILQNVDQLIKKASKESNIDKNLETTNQLRDMLLMGSNIGDKDFFLLMYKNMLNERLMNYTSNPQYEEEILKIFLNLKDEPVLYSKMRYLLWDAIISRRHDDVYRTINIRKRSEKYANVDPSSIDKNICNFFVTRSYVWDGKEKDEDAYEVPDIIAVYMAIFSAYFAQQKHFVTNKLTYLHNQSTGVMAIKLKDDKTYNVQMSFPQMYVFITICRDGSTGISPTVLSEKLAIPLSKIGRILNSLLLVNLVKRGVGEAKNPNIPFFINLECAFDEVDVSIVPAFKKFMSSSNPAQAQQTQQAQQAQQAQQTQTQVSTQEEQKNDINPTIINAKVLMLLSKAESPMTFDVLKQQVYAAFDNKNIDMTVFTDAFTSELERIVSTDYVKFENGMYRYQKKSIVELDSDDEDEPESTTDSSMAPTEAAEQGHQKPESYEEPDVVKAGTPPPDLAYEFAHLLEKATSSDSQLNVLSAGISKLKDLAAELTEEIEDDGNGLYEQVNDHDSEDENDEDEDNEGNDNENPQAPTSLVSSLTNFIGLSTTTASKKKKNSHKKRSRKRSAKKHF